MGPEGNGRRSGKPIAILAADATVTQQMRAETNKSKILAFMEALGKRVSGPGHIYFAGGATALLNDWRVTTIDIDIKPEPEPSGLFEVLAMLKDELDANIELAGTATDQISCDRCSNVREFRESFRRGCLT